MLRLARVNLVNRSICYVDLCVNHLNDCLCCLLTSNGSIYCVYSSVICSNNSLLRTCVLGSTELMIHRPMALRLLRLLTNDAGLRQRATDGFPRDRAKEREMKPRNSFFFFWVQDDLWPTSSSCWPAFSAGAVQLLTIWLRVASLFLNK